jgi:hypothetical protein
MRLGPPPTSDRNELSSSGTFTGATSKNLNCHFSRVSVAMSGGAVPARAYRSDCHTAATVPCSLLPHSPLAYRDREELGAGTRDEPHANTRCRLAYRAMTAASVLTFFCALLFLSPSPSLQPSTSTLLSCAIIHGPLFFALQLLHVRDFTCDSLPRVPPFNTRCRPRPARPFVSRSTSDTTHVQSVN